MGDPARHSIDVALANSMEIHLGRAATILELGSGEGTKCLCDRFERVISIEHDERYLEKTPAAYIHAPLEPFQSLIFPRDTHWYSRDVLRTEMPRLRYDAILIDGPPNRYGRGGFWCFQDLFRLDVPIFIDDTHRDREALLARLLSHTLNRELFTSECIEGRCYSVVLK